MELEKAKEIHNFYMANNVSLAATGKQFGYHATYIEKVFRKYDLPRKSRNATRERKINVEELKHLYLNEHYSTLELAKHFGVAHGTITNRLLDLGVSRTVQESLSVRQGFHLWTPELESKVQKFLKETPSYIEASKKFGIDALKIQSKNLSSWRIPLNLWTPELSAKCKELLEYHLDYDRVAAILNIPRQSIACKNYRTWKISLMDNCNIFGIPTLGKDGFKYRSKLEAKVANLLWDNGIWYENERWVCETRRWRADFYFNDTFVEVDGLGIWRNGTGDKPYDINDKIKYYKDEGLNYFVIKTVTYKKDLATLDILPTIQWARTDITMRTITYQEAKRFCARYHYTRTCPSGDTKRFGFFWKDRLVGLVTFGGGANRHMASGLINGDFKVLELTRLCIVPAMAKNFASFIMAKALKQIDADLVISYADANQGHVGTIYQAANWLYTGMTRPDYQYVTKDGVRLHKSRFRVKNGKMERELAAAAGVSMEKIVGKHRYVYVCDRGRIDEMVGLLKYPIVPYPKAA